VVVGTTVQPKNVIFAINAKLIHWARDPPALHPAKQFKRSNRPLRTLRTGLGRTVRDIRHRIGKDEKLQNCVPMSSTKRRQSWSKGNPGDRKIYSLHAPEVE
jgi:IS5 family transposase